LQSVGQYQRHAIHYNQLRCPKIALVCQPGGMKTCYIIKCIWRSMK